MVHVDVRQVAEVHADDSTEEGHGVAGVQVPQRRAGRGRGRALLVSAKGNEGDVITSRHAKSPLVIGIGVMARVNGGRHLHQSHHPAVDEHTGIPGMPLWAHGRVAATDDDRVGDRQPPPRGGIGGPCRLHRSNGRTQPVATAVAQHPSAGAASPRPHVWSSGGNPCVSRLASDSTAKVHSIRARTEARGHGEMPGQVGANTRGAIMADLLSTFPSADAVPCLNAPRAGVTDAAGPW